MGQGQPRVIIWTTLVVLPYTMLHTKFQGHWSICSGAEDCLRFLPYMGMAILVMWPRSFEQLFFPKGPGGCIWNLFAISPVVSEEKLFEIVDGRKTDIRTTDNGACLYQRCKTRFWFILYIVYFKVYNSSWVEHDLIDCIKSSPEQIKITVSICKYILCDDGSGACSGINALMQ